MSKHVQMYVSVVVAFFFIFGAVAPAFACEPPKPHCKNDEVLVGDHCEKKPKDKPPVVNPPVVNPPAGKLIVVDTSPEAAGNPADVCIVSDSPKIELTFGQQALKVGQVVNQGGRDWSVTEKVRDGIYRCKPVVALTIASKVDPQCKSTQVFSVWQKSPTGIKIQACLDPIVRAYFREGGSQDWEVNPTTPGQVFDIKFPQRARRIEILSISGKILWSWNFWG